MVPARTAGRRNASGEALMKDTSASTNENMGGWSAVALLNPSEPP